MKWADFTGKSVALLGAGVENRSLVRHLVRAGVSELVIRDISPLAENEFSEQVKLMCGQNYLDNLSRHDYLFRSPGLPLGTVRKALGDAASSCVLTSATDLFLALRPGKTVGITGTKGKGTTATMIGQILSSAGIVNYVVGNIGKSVFDIYDNLTDQSVVVLELSSFQLEDVRHSPQIVVILPIFKDHLEPLSKRSPNYHKNMTAYVKAKGKIAEYQTENDFLIYAADNDFTASIAQTALSKKLTVSQVDAAADFYVDKNGVIMRCGHQYLDLRKTNLRGYHLFLNAAVAVAATSVLGSNQMSSLAGLKSFQGLPHRLEEVALINGVKFVDDSYATVPEATIAALSAYKEPTILIAGGSRKGVSFKKLSQAVAASSVKAVFLIGEEATRIANELKSVSKNLPVVICKTLSQAVSQAKATARKGWVILLSPACASTDMFVSAGERGDQFRKLTTNGV